MLDFHNLHQMSLVLSEAGLASDAAFTVKEHFSTTPGLSSLPEVHILCIVIVITGVPEAYKIFLAISQR